MFVHNFVPLNPPPNQQNDGFPLEFLVKEPQPGCEHPAKIASEPSKDSEQTDL